MLAEIVGFPGDCVLLEQRVEVDGIRGYFCPEFRRGMRAPGRVRVAVSFAMWH